MLKRIGAEEGGEFKAVASGTLPSGKSVVVNADGTVAVVSQTSATQALGSVTVFASANTTNIKAAFDSNSNKVVIAYTDGDNSDHGTAIVGTVDSSDNSISFGSEVVFNAGQTTQINVVFDTSNNKIVITYKNDASSDNGTAIVATVSGTGISFGSPAEFETSDAGNQAAVFDSTNNKVVIVYRDGNNSNYGTAVVATVSGTSISFGTAVVFTSTNLQHPSIGFDSSNGKVVIAYQDTGDSNKGKAIVGTVSGTSISFGSAVAFESGATNQISTIYDSDAQKIVIAYQDDDNSDYGTAIVGTVSGTSISFGTAVAFESAATNYAQAVYDTSAKKVVITYSDGGNSDYGTVISGTVSGTSISFDTAAVFESATTAYIGLAYDSNAEKVVIAYRDYGNSSHGTSRVFQTGYSNTNLTSENYIGMSRGVAFQESISEALGSATVFNTANSENIASAYDSTNNKVVAFYKASSALNAIVGTVSNGSISFGSSTEFNAGSGEYISAGFDSSNGKLVVAYKKTSDNYLYSKVGTVSGTSISYGSRATFESASVSEPDSVFDTDNGKVVIAYKDQGNSNYGTAVIGTVSGTSISFGTPVVFESAVTKPSINYVGSSKVFIGSQIGGGTGTRDGKGIVGTVSGTSISFGSAVVFESDDVRYVSPVYHSAADKVIVFYQDNGNSDYGSYVIGTISGTSVSFTSSAVFESAKVSYVASVYDSNDERAVAFYRDEGNSTYGTSITYRPSYLQTTRGEVASGQAASMDIIGSVSDNQIGLTAGQQYFVQTDGTIGTTAATPSVLAGTAISATELVVKT